MDRVEDIGRDLGRSARNARTTRDDANSEVLERGHSYLADQAGEDRTGSSCIYSVVAAMVLAELHGLTNKQNLPTER